jgi:hypothetical protein
MEIFDGTNAIGSLTTTESPDVHRLLDMQAITGPSEWTVRVQIRANGGSGSAALVLTDFTTSFGVAVVPEPSACVMSAYGGLWLTMIYGTRRRAATQN